MTGHTRQRQTSHETEVTSYRVTEDRGRGNKRQRSEETVTDVT